MAVDCSVPCTEDYDCKSLTGDSSDAEEGDKMYEIYSQLTDFEKQVNEANTCYQVWERRKEEWREHSILPMDTTSNVQSMLTQVEDCMDTVMEEDPEWHSCELPHDSSIETKDIEIVVSNTSHKPGRIIDVAQSLRRIEQEKRKQQYLEFHKVHLLLLLAHGMQVSRLVNASVVDNASELYDLISDSNISVSHKDSLLLVKSIVDHYRANVSLATKRNGKRALKIKKAIRQQIVAREASSRRMYNLILLTVLRFCGIRSRLVMHLDVVPKCPPAAKPPAKVKISQSNRPSVTDRYHNVPLTTTEILKRKPEIQKMFQLTQLDGADEDLVDGDLAPKKLRIENSTNKPRLWKLKPEPSLGKQPREKTQGQVEHPASNPAESDQRIVKLVSSKFFRKKASLKQRSMKGKLDCRTELNDQKNAASIKPNLGRLINHKAATIPCDGAKKRHRIPKLDLWVECFLEPEQRWTVVEASLGDVDCMERVMDLIQDPPVYVFAFEADDVVVDVSERYRWRNEALALKQRVDKKWLKKALRQHKPPMGVKRSCWSSLNIDSLNFVRQCRPQSRNLQKFQGIYPPDAPPLGYINGEPVYARECVHTLHSREVWLRHAKVIRMHELPYKVVKSKLRREQTNLELFGYWQTEDYIPPEPIDGIVPRNAYGNIEIFKDCMLPKGTVHLKLHAGGNHPVFDGIVICEEHRDRLLEAWEIHQEESAQKKLQKKRQMVLNNWVKLVKVTSQPRHPITMTSAKLTVAEVSESMQRFGLVDYVVFVTSLLICVVIGVHFGWKDWRVQQQRKHNVRRGSEALNYLVGGRKMKIFPVAMSLIASFISGIAVMGSSTETYLHGTQFCYIFTGILLMAVSMNYIFLPVYQGLDITSAYAYLQMRFDRRIRLLGSGLFVLATLLHLPIVIYVPALAFNQVSGINVHVVSTSVCLVCIFYTLVGGIKAVVWTDVIQMFIMIGALILIVIKGTADIGGLSVLIERNMASGRIEPPNFSFDPTERHTIWAIFIGGGSFWMGKNAIHQMMIQRYLALPSFRDAQKALVCFTVGIILLLMTCFYNGLLIYATFHDCDPLTTGLAKAKDQLLPVLLMKVLADIPGLAGLFISGIFSASLSSLSTGLNSLSAIVLEDFVKPFTRRPLSERGTRYIMRSTVFVFGIVAVVLVLVVEKLGTVLQLAMSLVPISLGPLLGLFLMGMLLPWVDASSAFGGAISGLMTMSYIVIRAQIAVAAKEMPIPGKPVSVEGCDYTFDLPVGFNTTSIPPLGSAEKSLHHVSYLYYTFIGAVTTVIVGSLAAAIFRRQQPDKLDPLLLAPFVRKLYHSETIPSSESTISESTTFGSTVFEAGVDRSTSTDSSNLHGPSVEEISRSLQRFNWPDYVVFVLMLFSCMVIGVFFGVKDHQKHKRQKHARRGSEALDYLVGGRKMQIIPVSVSLVASWISGISLLGTSTEIYVYGVQYCYIISAVVLMGLAMNFIFLPVFHDLQITSAYEVCVLEEQFVQYPTARNTFWTLLIGGTFFWTSTNAINQNMMQRYLSLPSLGSARKALVLFLVGTVTVLAMCCYNGLLIFAMYHDCDPLTTGLAKAKDQLVPLLVMEVLGEYPGLAGLFVAGIFSAALSSLSTALNSLSAIVLEDFCKPFVSKPLTETQTRYILRFTVLAFGALAVVMVVVVEKMGAVLQLSMSLGPVTLGPLFGLFVMGFFFPRINGSSAIVGTAAGLALMSYIVIRSQISIALKEIVFAEKPVTVEGCQYEFTPKNGTLFESDYTPGEKSLHHVSFLYYTMIGSVVPTLVGYLSSFILPRTKTDDIDPLLLAPFLRRFYPSQNSKPHHMTEVLHEFETKDIQL
ncbi:hypothetical protein ZHAS_00004598 [Anopheles sinensis]|uniref:Sodium/solute symporter n=1 Tax=Anopheles sinensis TaxID=74873 RepID=A0A084VHL7_ANOSI|nr:hypothetical protein ZHAS_00004598 [Anopheles sinensis]